MFNINILCISIVEKINTVVSCKSSMGSNNQLKNAMNRKLDFAMCRYNIGFWNKNDSKVNYRVSFHACEIYTYGITQPCLILVEKPVLWKKSSISCINCIFTMWDTETNITIHFLTFLSHNKWETVNLLSISKNISSFYLPFIHEHSIYKSKP